MTVGELVALLADKPQDAQVRCWLPGSRIDLAGTINNPAKGEVLIEGNVVPGSALDRAFA